MSALPLFLLQRVGCKTERCNQTLFSKIHSASTSQVLQSTSKYLYCEAA